MVRQLAMVLSAVVIAACGGSGTASDALDEQMRRDLEAVQANTIEMAPAGGGQRVVSAIEQTPRVQPRPTAPRPRAPEVASRETARPEPLPAAEPAAQAAQPASTEPAAVVPTSAPKISPPPPGGYKTVGEVIRNAPFPIKPAATVKPPR